MNTAIKSYHVYQSKVESNQRKLFFVESLLNPNNGPIEEMEKIFQKWVEVKGIPGTHYILDVELFCTQDSFVNDEKI